MGWGGVGWGGVGMLTFGWSWTRHWCYAEHGVGWGCERSFEVEHAIDATLSMGWGGVGMLTFVWSWTRHWCYAEHGVGWGCERPFEVEHATDATLSMGRSWSIHSILAMEMGKRVVSWPVEKNSTGLHAQWSLKLARQEKARCSFCHPKVIDQLIQTSCSLCVELANLFGSIFSHSLWKEHVRKPAVKSSSMVNATKTEFIQIRPWKLASREMPCWWHSRSARSSWFICNHQDQRSRWLLTHSRCSHSWGWGHSCRRSQWCRWHQCWRLRSTGRRSRITWGIAWLRISCGRVAKRKKNDLVFKDFYFETATKHWKDCHFLTMVMRLHARFRTRRVV